MYLNTFNGVRNVDRRVVEAARSFGVEGRQLVRRVVVPLAMPSIMTGLRFSAGSRSSRSSSPRASAPARASATWCRRPTACSRSPSSSCASSFTHSSGSRPTFPSAYWSATPCRGAVIRRSDEHSHDTARRHRGRRHQDASATATSWPTLDLTVAQGEFVALLGASGSGKTTLLRILAGLEVASSGEVLVPRGAHRRLPRAAAGGVNEASGATSCSGSPAAESTRQRAVTALREVGLEDHADAWPGTLSGGEAQRVALARALVREPQAPAARRAVRRPRRADPPPDAEPGGRAVRPPPPRCSARHPRRRGGHPAGRPGAGAPGLEDLRGPTRSSCPGRAGSVARPSTSCGTSCSPNWGSSPVTR